MTTPEIEKKIEEFVKLLGRMGDWVGDGHYCRHHPDDPAHGEKCYEFPQAILVRQTLQEMYEMGQNDERIEIGTSLKKAEEMLREEGARDMKKRALEVLPDERHIQKRYGIVEEDGQDVAIAENKLINEIVEAIQSLPIILNETV